MHRGDPSIPERKPKQFFTAGTEEIQAFPVLLLSCSWAALGCSWAASGLLLGCSWIASGLPNWS